MPSETFVDVTWRGLEVGRRVKLRAIRPATAQLDHGTPMPVGTVLAIKTDEGIELTATVTRVHEQVGGSTEVPGMQVVPALEGAAQAWWQARAEPEPEPVVAPPIAVTEVGDASDRTTLSMTKAQLADALAAVRRARDQDASGGGVEDTANTQVMAAVSDEDLAAMEAAEAGADSSASLSSSSEPSDGDADNDSGRGNEEGGRTMVMSAVDVAAIVDAATGGTRTGEGDDDGASQDGPSQDGPSDGNNGDSLTRGKKKPRSATRRKKR